MLWPFIIVKVYIEIGNAVLRDIRNNDVLNEIRCMHNKKTTLRFCHWQCNQKRAVALKRRVRPGEGVSASLIASR